MNKVDNSENIIDLQEQITALEEENYNLNEALSMNHLELDALEDRLIDLEKSINE